MAISSGHTRVKRYKKKDDGNYIQQSEWTHADSVELSNGLTLDDLVNHDEKGSLRILFNLYAWNDWKESFEYHGTADYKEDLW